MLNTFSYALLGEDYEASYEESMAYFTENNNQYIYTIWL